ncbi:MAG TPA: hypothetical protein PKV35_00675 [bacterium]|nr:hypothetical protein [bacterium]
MKFKAGELKGKTVEEIEQIFTEKAGFWKNLPKMRIIPNVAKEGEFVFEILKIDDQGEYWEARNFDTYDKCLIRKATFIHLWGRNQIEKCLNGRR